MDIDYGKYALLHANGLPLHETFRLFSHDLAEYIRDNHHINEGRPCNSGRCHGGKAAKLIDPEA